MLRCMAGAAGGCCVFAVEKIARLAVVKASGRWIPMQHVEVFAVMVGVAFDAGRPWRAAQRKASVQAVVVLDFGRNFRVTFGAAKCCGASGNGMTLGAVGGATECLMGPGQRAGRNLRASRQRKNQAAQQSKGSEANHEL